MHAPSVSRRDPNGGSAYGTFTVNRPETGEGSGIVVLMTDPQAIDMSNIEQMTSWNGATGDFWVEHADEFDLGVSGYQGPFLAAAAIAADDRVLDIGCGAGQSTRAAARLAHHGSALGVDLSAQLLELARRRATDEAVTNTEFVQADAQVHPFATGGADVAISRHGAMFFADPTAAFTNLDRALRPGGRLVLLTWQPLEHNEFLHAVWTALAVGRPTPTPPSDAPSPFALSDPDRIRSLLSDAGFKDVTIGGLARPMNFGTDPDRAAGYLARQHAGMLVGLDDTTRTRALDALHASVADHNSTGGVLYDSAAWLITART